MAFVNNYVPPAVPDFLGPLLPEDQLWGPEPYDINFAFPLHLDTLESERVKVVPFIPRLYAHEYWKHVGGDAHIFRFYTFFLPTFPHFLTYLENKIRKDPGFIFFAIIDKTKPDPEHPHFGGSLAGAVSLFDVHPVNLRCEIAFVIIFPAFQRTHVASNAVGLLATYCLQQPGDSPPGIGMRRVQWTAHPRNSASIRLGTRIGMRHEGILRSLCILPEALWAEGSEGPESDPRRGRDTCLLAVCWNDWEGGVRESVRALIDRKV